MLFQNFVRKGAGFENLLLKSADPPGKFVDFLLSGIHSPFDLLRRKHAVPFNQVQHQIFPFQEFSDSLSVFCFGLGQLLLLLLDIGNSLFFDKVLLVHGLCPVCGRPVTDLLVLCAVIALINGDPLILPCFRVVRLSGSGCKNAATAVTVKDIARQKCLTSIPFGQAWGRRLTIASL